MYWLVKQDTGSGFYSGLSWVRNIDVDMTDEDAARRARISMFTPEESITQMPLRPKDYDFIASHRALAEEEIDKLPDCFQGFTFRSQVIS
jgi:hypothetical protein